MKGDAGRVRCYIAPETWVSGGPLQPGPEEAHHLMRVLRLREGAAVEAFDGRGRLAQCRARTGGRRLVLEVQGEEQVEPPRTRLVLACGIVRPQRMDWCVQKATELGMMRFVPLLCERNRAGRAEAAAAGRVERWRRIAQEAARQCGRAYVPEIASPQPLEKVLAEIAGAGRLRLFCVPEPGAESLRQVLEEADRVPGELVVLIGPEGDFSRREKSLGRESGCRLVDLGGNILRSETAALYVCAAARYHFADALEEGRPERRDSK